MAFKFGRLAPYPESTHPRLRASTLLRSGVPVPATVDYASKVNGWPMYLNDQLGCCTISAQGHCEEAWSRYGQGVTVEVSDADVLAAYEAVSGYRPGHPDTDQGATMQDACSHWRKVGIAGHKISAFAQVDHTDPVEVKAALYHLGHVYVGVDLPQSAIDQFDTGQPWDVVADDGGIAGGHCVDLGYAGPDGYKVVTWGRVVPVTARWWVRYVEEAWCAVSTDWLSASGVSPEGLDLAALGAAFAQITGEPSPFRPTPQPPDPGPGPAPVGDPDTALVTALRHWLTERHVGDNAAAAHAVRIWMVAKRLAT